MSSGTFKAAPSTAAAISAVAAQARVPLTPLSGAQVAPLEPAGFEMIEPPASRVIAPGHGEVRIPMVLHPEIALARMPFPAAAAPAGRTVGEAADAVQDALFSSTDARALIDLIASSVEPDWGREGVLAYAQIVAEALLTTPASLLKLAPRELIAVLYFLARMSDRFTQHVTIAGISHPCTTDVANLMRPIFRAAQRQEEALLDAKAMTAETATRLAEIHFLYARKGRYYYALRDRARGRESGRTELVASILYAIEAADRFAALGQEEKAVRARETVRRMQQAHGIEGDPVAWAFEEYRVHLQQQVEELRELNPSLERLQFRPDVARLCYDELGVGLSSFAPSLLRMAESIFSAAGYDADAERFRFWMATAAAAAEQLHASTAPPPISSPAADSGE